MTLPTISRGFEPCRVLIRSFNLESLIDSDHITEEKVGETLKDANGILIPGKTSAGA
jgi:hypothetical protein